eukprot:1635807-Rhodomonas_salina.1
MLRQCPTRRRNRGQRLPVKMMANLEIKPAELMTIRAASSRTHLRENAAHRIGHTSAGNGGHPSRGFGCARSTLKGRWPGRGTPAQCSQTGAPIRNVSTGISLRGWRWER